MFCVYMHCIPTTIWFHCTCIIISSLLQNTFTLHILFAWDIHPQVAPFGLTLESSQKHHKKIERFHRQILHLKEEPSPGLSCYTQYNCSPLLRTLLCSILMPQNGRKGGGPAMQCHIFAMVLAITLQESAKALHFILSRLFELVIPAFHTLILYFTTHQSTKAIIIVENFMCIVTDKPNVNKIQLWKNKNE